MAGDGKVARAKRVVPMPDVRLVAHFDEQTRYAEILCDPHDPRYIVNERSVGYVVPADP